MITRLDIDQQVVNGIERTRKGMDEVMTAMMKPYEKTAQNQMTSTRYQEWLANPLRAAVVKQLEAQNPGEGEARMRQFEKMQGMV